MSAQIFDHTIEIVDATGRRHITISDSVVVGRESGDILVADGMVSGRHLCLDGSGPSLTVQDLGSSNGTSRNDLPVRGVDVLVVGDVVQLGGATIRFLATVARGGSEMPPPVATIGTISSDAVELRFVPGGRAAHVAKSYAASVARARRSLAGFGTEPNGVVPVIHLLDVSLEGAESADATDGLAMGSVVDAATARAWVAVPAAGQPEPPHRILALIFGAGLPAADSLELLIEGYGLHRSGADDPHRLSGRALPPLAGAEGELRAPMALSFIRFLAEREGDAGVRRLLASEPGRLDEVAREVYGPSMAQLEQQWRTKVLSGEPDVSTGDFLRLSLRHLRPYRRRQAEIFAYMLLSLAFVAAFPFVTRRLFDTALPSGEFSQVVGLLGALGVAFVVSIVAGVRQAYQTAWVSGAVTRDIRQTIFDRVQVLPSAWFRDHPQGDVLSRLFNDVGAVQNGLSQAIGQGVYQVLSLAVSTAIMLSIDVWLGLVVLVAAPLVGVVYRKMSAGAQRRSIAVQENSSALLSIAAENYRANPVVKMFGLAGRERTRFAQQGDRMFRAGRRLTLWGGLFGLSVNLIVTVLRLVVLGLGAWLILRGHFTVGGLVAFLSIMGDVLSPVTVLVTLSQDVQASMGSLVRINEVIDAAAEAAESDGATDVATGDVGVPPITGEIRLEHLGLSYTPERRALDDLDVCIRAGTRVAFVGPSGSGKSTVLRVLMRLYEPDEGAVLVDGVDIRSIGLSAWRDQLGVVFQDSFLFDASVRENIALGRRGASDAEIEAAAAAAEVDAFLPSLARGWDTLVGEGGGNLSGGQRQRVAIARALVRNPRLLLLDEATSALDPGTERQINETIERVSRGRTVIAVTHRLASITNYDRVFVVVDGTVAEQGTHDELLAAGGVYAGLWAEQTGIPAITRDAVPAAAVLAPPKSATRLTRTTFVYQEAP